MKFLIMLIVCLLMVLQSHSQTISIKEQRVQAFVNQKGDTLIQMSLADAKVILTTVLEKEIADSLIQVYINRDSLNQNTISLQLKEIRALQQKEINNGKQIINLNNIIKNKDTEIKILNKSLEDEKKATKKQTRLKKLGFVGCVVLPITTLIVMLSILG